jgi:hypothetical protein
MTENLLKEELERMRILSNYKTELTLTENLDLLVESGFFAKLIQGYSDDFIKTISAQLDNIIPSLKNAGGAEKVLALAKQGKASANVMQELQQGLLKNAKQTDELVGLADAAAEGYAKQLANSKGTKAVQFQNASAADRKVLLKQNGYSDDGIKRIMKKYDSIAPPPIQQGKKSLIQKTKEGLTKAKENLTKYKDNLLTSLKTKGWKKTLAFAAGIGITGAVLWQFAKDNGVQSEGQPEQPPQDTPVTGYGTSSSSSTSYEIPSELVDVKGVQDFQTWLDTNKPGWHSKYQTLGGNVQKGFGKFGPNTSRAWQDEEIKKAYLASKGQQNPSQEEPIPTKRELEQPVKLDRPDRNTQISNQIPQNLSTQAPTFQVPQTNLTPQQQRKVERMRNRQQQ